MEVFYMGAGILALIIIGGVVLLLVLWAILCYNGFIKLRTKSEEGFATIDVYLKKRCDLIPNLVETVKGYAKHESTTLEKVIAARNLAMTSGTIDDKIANENALTGTLKTLFALTESYPELKADTSFVRLQSELSGIENEIALARKYYNAVVKDFNMTVQVFPNVIIAGMFGFKRLPFFEADEASRENVKVSF